MIAHHHYWLLAIFVAARHTLVIAEDTNPPCQVCGRWCMISCGSCNVVLKLCLLSFCRMLLLPGKLCHGQSGCHFQSPRGVRGPILWLDRGTLQFSRYNVTAYTPDDPPSPGSVWGTSNARSQGSDPPGRLHGRSANV
jgi:hypothetical protein